MKKLLYIAFLFISVLLVSCSKQDIVPVTDNTEEAPRWSSFEKSGSDDPVIDSIDDDGENPSDDDGNEIVDPRFDPDGKGK